MIPLCVPPDKVENFWPHVSHFIEAALSGDKGDDDAGTVWKDLVEGNSLLWIAWDGEKITAAITTKLLLVPRGKICRITTCGGNGLFRWKDGLPAIEAYAKSEGCDLMRFEGRKGFVRVFPDYHQPWVVLEKAL